MATDGFRFAARAGPQFTPPPFAEGLFRCPWSTRLDHGDNARSQRRGQARPRLDDGRQVGRLPLQKRQAERQDIFAIVASR